MRLAICLVLLPFFLSEGCKSKNPSKLKSKTSQQGADADEENEARPIVAETEFTIASALPVTEGVISKRPEGGIEVAGGVAGIWDKAVSPVYVTSDITVGPDKVLEIKAGVQVIFQGKYRISVEGGQLKIAGTAAEKIRFSAETPAEGWAGIRVCPDTDCRQEEARGRLEVRHAIFEHARKENLDPNDATWRRGGVFYIRGTLTALIEDSAFLANYAQERGGAIEIIADNRNLIFRRNEFNGNRNDGGSGGGGGALHITHGRNLTVENNSFTSNASKGSGGAIYLLDSAGIVLKGNTFKDNAAVGKGGAIRCDGHAALISIDASNAMQGNKPDDLSCDP